MRSDAGEAYSTQRYHVACIIQKHKTKPPPRSLCVAPNLLSPHPRRNFRKSWWLRIRRRHAVRRSRWRTQRASVSWSAQRSATSQLAYNRHIQQTSALHRGRASASSSCIADRTLCSRCCTLVSSQPMWSCFRRFGCAPAVFEVRVSHVIRCRAAFYAATFACGHASTASAAPTKPCIPSAKPDRQRVSGAACTWHAAMPSFGAALL